MDYGSAEKNKSPKKEKEKKVLSASHLLHTSIRDAMSKQKMIITISMVIFSQDADFIQLLDDISTFSVQYLPE